MGAAAGHVTCAAPPPPPTPSPLAQMVVKGLAAFGARYGLPHHVIEEGTLPFTLLTTLVAYLGLSTQLRTGFGAPLSFPLSILLLPLDLLESLVKFAVYVFV